MSALRLSHGSFRPRAGRHWSRLLCSLSLLGSASTAAWELTPFEARYEVRYGAIPFSVDGMRILARQGEGWVFETRLDAGLARIAQHSELRQAPLEPQQYRYLQRGIAGSKDRILHFDRDAGIVRRSGDKSGEQPLKPGAWDPLSWQLALRRDVATGNRAPGQSFDYLVTDGGEYKQYRFTVLGAEPVRVPAGGFEALKVERSPEAGAESRRTVVWLAEQLDWLMVRLELSDDDGATLKLELESIEARGGDGKAP